MRLHWWFACILLAGPAAAQSGPQWNLAEIFSFDYGLPGAFPAGWTYGTSDGTVVTDCTTTAHSGACSARITHGTPASGAYSYLQSAIAFQPSGSTLQWSGWVRTSAVNGAAALYFGQVDANDNGLNYQNLNVQGTTGWTHYSITLPVNSQAEAIYFGFQLNGTGSAWVDDLQLSLDGQSLAPAIPSGFASDHQFDLTSLVGLSNASDVQTQNLFVLGKVWGFLKYYHPALTSGQRNWDYDLFRVLPAVLAAPDAPTANQAISDWISATAGAPPTCSPCATLDTSDLYLGTHLDWIADTSLLGSSLSQTLQSVYANRTPQAQSFFVSLVPGVGNPSFQFESYYSKIPFPDRGYQLLALFRAWNMVEYFYPNRDVMADDPAADPTYWDDVLKQSIPVFAAAQNTLAYEQAVLLFKAHINDTHSGISNLGGLPPSGACQLPVQIRFVEGVPVVTGYLSANGASSGLQIGDVVQNLDGNNTADLVTVWSPYYTDSNQAARLRDIANNMTWGTCAYSSVMVLRGGQQLTVNPLRVAYSTLDFTSNGEDDRPGPAFQILPGNIAYLKLSSVDASQSASYIQSAAGTRALIIDIRNYPSNFVVFTLGDLLVSQPVNFVQFTNGDVTTPGAFHWGSILGLTPARPYYPGKVVVLVNEITQSQAEYTALAFRAAGATIVGSTTAGADGNVSMVPLPGGFWFYFSGIGVFYPNHKPTQRVGIVPDVIVTPTIAGIQAGRDEVLDAAIRFLEMRKDKGKPVGVQ